MRNLILLLLLGFLPVDSVATGASDDLLLAIEKRADESSVSLIQLIANPDVFDGRHVAIQGFLSLSNDYENSLFVDENAYRVGLTANSIAVDLDESSIAINSRAKERNRQYVTIAGRFRAGPTAFSGGKLEGVYRLLSTVRFEE